MTPRNVAVGLLAVAAAVWGVAGGVAVPAVAASSATPGSITVQPSQSLSPGANVGLLSVSIASTSPITSLTVSLFTPGTSTDVLDLPMSDFAVPADDGDNNFGTWTLTSPITTSQLPALGDYSAFVTAADSGSDSISDVFAGTLQFVNVVSVDDFRSNGTVFNFDKPNVTFQGTAMFLAPGGAPVPYANETTLGLQGNFGQAVPVTTAADGTFSVTVQAQNEFYWIAYTGPADTEGGSSNNISITVNAFPDHLSAALKIKHAKLGQKDSVSGTMTYTDHGATKPVPGYTVSLLENGDFDPVATAVTNARGQYTMPVSTKLGDITWELQSKGTQFLSSTTALVSMTVAQPNGFSSFRASLSAFGVVSVSGCMRTDARPLKIEYASKKAGPWRTLGRILAESGESCDNNRGMEFSGTFPARLGSAYYRAHYTGSFDWQPAISKALHLSRLFTKITSFDVSPRSGPRNSHITVSGRLWAQGKSGKWRPYAHKKLIVVFKFQGTFYRYAAEPQTNGAGRFRGRFKLLVSAPMFAQYNGDKTHFASASKRIKVSATGSAAVPAGAAGAGAMAARALRDGEWVRVRAVA